jgi:hypothetical protein
MSWIQMMADIIAELSQDLKAEVISELNDQSMQKILSICCVMMRTLQGIDGRN